ncbi:hypothetical protein BGW42_000169 [Actinomortierella wolfii]|nr:hypothetical protein BGW42_000169 [Actinomortierella wolfii]
MHHTPSLALNIETRDALSALIQTATKTGELQLDPDQKIKSICKKSENNVRCAYDLIMNQLKQKHAQIRYSCTQLIQELFQRSHVFRDCLVEDYPTFLQLTVGIHQHTLPPPVAFAEKTKQLAISLTNEWFKKYGTVYKQVDFTNLVPVTDEAKKEAKMAHEAARRRSLLDKYQWTVTEIEEKAQDIKENVRKMQSCFDILVPRLDDDDALRAIFGGELDDQEEKLVQENDEEQDDDDANQMVGAVHHDPLGVFENALGSSRYKLTVNVSKTKPFEVTETPENTELFSSLRESYRLIISKQWPLVKRWMDLLENVDKEIADSERDNFEKILAVVADLKESLEDAKFKSEDLGVNMETMYGPHDGQSDDEDEDFEAVDVSSVTKGKDKAKPRTPGLKPTQPKKRNQVFAMQGEEILAEDPTYIGGTRVELIQRPAEQSVKAPPKSEEPLAEGEETREQLLARAPVVPWDDDLSYWDKKEVMFNTSGLEYNHRFLGVGDGSNLVSQATLDRMKMRTTIYTPKMPTKIKACRHPLKNGGLCPRRDLVKCPFHGVIVPRDEEGRIVKPGESEADRIQEEVDARRAEEGDIFAIYRQAVAGKFKSASSSKKAALLGAITAAVSSPSPHSSTAPSSKNNANVPAATAGKDRITWEDIEEDVSKALGMKRQGAKNESEKANNKKKKQSALINLNKLPETPKTRLERRLNAKVTRDQVEQEIREARSLRSRDTGLNRWRE